MKYLIKNAKVITPFRELDNTDILVKDGLIDKIGVHLASEDSIIVDATDCIVIPGLIDIHTHGAGGCDVMDLSLEAFKTISTYKVKMGCTSFLPTSLSCSFDNLKRLLEIFKDIYDKKMYKKWNGAYMIGLNIEGPFISGEMRGAQPVEYIYAPTKEMGKYLLNFSKYIKIITMAPEIPAVLELATQLRNAGVLISIGHSDATFEDVLVALEHGFSHVTHIYSAMSTVRRINLLRVPGVIEAAYLFDDLTVEMIADGKHLPPSLMKLIIEKKPLDKIIAITDSMRAAGMQEGKYKIGGEKDGFDVIVEDGVAKLIDRTAFAGSVARVDDLLRNLVNLVKIDIPTATRLLTVNPAKELGIFPRKGIINIGSDADLVVLDAKLNVVMTLVEGNIAFEYSNYVCVKSSSSTKNEQIHRSKLSGTI